MKTFKGIKVKKIPIKAFEGKHLPNYDLAPTDPHHGGKYSYKQWLQALIEGSVVCADILERGTDPGQEWFVERYNEATSVEDTIMAILLLSAAKKGPFASLTDASKFDDPKTTTPLCKTMKWMKSTMRAIHEARGSPDVLDKFPEDLIDTMIRNNLHVIYNKDSE